MNHDTSITQQKDSNDTSTSSNNVPFAGVTIRGFYNRKIYRYAKKHHITEEEAIKRLYK